MRATVLRDPRLQKHARRFVWLSIDTENARNAAFVERFPLEVWPTFLVIDPSTEAIRATWPGGATVEQLEAFLTGAAGDGRPDVVILAQQASGQWERCAGTARARAPSLERDVPFALVVGAGLACTLAAPQDFAWRSEALAALEPLGVEALQITALGADDRAGLYESLVEARRARGDDAGARALAERWWSFLEGERKRGRTPEVRTALDSYRVGAALALGDPARALPALAASERELPRDYNPPARTARLLLELGRLDEARAAAQRALSRAYGPRKLRVYQLAAQIEERGGDRAAERALLEAALRHAESLPEAQRSARLLESLRKRRSALAEAG
jgi:hypothetical protein